MWLVGVICVVRVLNKARQNQEDGKFSARNGTTFTELLGGNDEHGTIGNTVVSQNVTRTRFNHL